MLNDYYGSGYFLPSIMHENVKSLKQLEYEIIHSIIIELIMLQYSNACLKPLLVKFINRISAINDVLLL